MHTIPAPTDFSTLEGICPAEDSLPIAGPAWIESGNSLGPRGGTGFGARLLARTVELLIE